MHPLLNIATRALREAGKYLVCAAESSAVQAAQPLPLNLLTGIQQRAQKLLTAPIKRSYPEHRWGESLVGEGPLWLLTPCDGTVNFFRGDSNFALSMAVWERGQVLVAALYVPLRDELFTAERGRGARCNTHRLRLNSASSQPLWALGAEGAPPDPDFFKKIEDQRRSGSTLIDVTNLLTNRVDGVIAWNSTLSARAAAMLLIQEAGGLILTWEGRPAALESSSFIASHPNTLMSHLRL